MEKEHDWLLIGSYGRNNMRIFDFRCKWCNETDEAFTVDGPPKKRYMLDECELARMRTRLRGLGND